MPPHLASPPGVGEEHEGSDDEPPAYFFSMFQKIVTGDSSMPLMFLRIATGEYHWPRKACVGYSDTRTCMATASSLRLAGSPSSAKVARSLINSSSRGQPNQAFSPTALI